MTMKRRFLRLIRNRRGSTLVEFAMLAPVMIVLIAGSIEIGRLAMIQSSLEAAVGKAARDAMVDLKTSQDEREAKMIQSIKSLLAPYKTFPGRDIVIETKVYQDIGSSFPEAYEDLNENGSYDGPDGSFTGEPFDDRNRNGERDTATQLDSKLGDEGDVVSYTAHMPVDPAFDFLPFATNNGEPIILSSTVVMRNEPVKR